MSKIKIGAGIGAISLVSAPAFAAVPTEISTMFTDLTTDAGTLVGLAVALAVAAYAGLWLLSFAKKAGSRAS